MAPMRTMVLPTRPTYPRAEHPVVRTHPVTGKKALYVNRGFTKRIVGVPRDESAAILHYLWDHAENELFQCRFRWRENSIAFWDNRCVQHRAMWDYWPHTRSGHRVTVAGRQAGVMANAPTSPLGVYLEHLEKGELAYQFSPDANAAVFYPRVICPFTGSDNLQWRISKGVGTVHATTVVFPQKGDPYNVALIDVDEGFRMMSRVEDIPPLDVSIGMRVKFRVHPAEGDEPPYPVFTPPEARHERPYARQRRHRGRGRIRYRCRCREHEPARSDGAGHSSRADRLRAEADAMSMASSAPTTQARTSAMSLCEYLRLPHAYTDSTIVGGSSFEVHVGARPGSTGGGTVLGAR